MARFSGKVAVITGGTTGIGLATARALLAEGARVIVTGRDEKAIVAARAELGAGALVLRSDTADLGQIDELAAQVQTSHGTIDALFINAGVGQFAPVDAVSPEFFDRIFDINVRGAFFTVQKLLPLLRDGSAVVLNTSVADAKGMPSMSVYSASKAALRSLARTLSADLLPRRIRVNAVSPGPITTPILAKAGLDAATVAQFEQQITESNPMKRYGTPDEVARAVLFLLSDEATYTTGAELAVDGGAGQL